NPARGGPRPAPPPPTALPAAHQVTVEQLVFHCDFDLTPDNPLVRQLTAERADICATLNLAASAEPIDVYLFRDAGSYGQFLARRFPSVPTRRAFFVERDTRLTVYAHWSERVGEDLRHEVAHGYLHSMVPGLPLWLDEGLAEYFEVPRGNNGLNPPHLELLTDMMKYNGWRPNLARLAALTEAGQMDQRDYAEAWGWVFFMLQSDAENRQMLITYLADLRATGTPESLPTRLAARNANPEETLVKFLTARNGELIAAKQKSQK
ncbi:MAG: DUF1570 domain-containing protein, partial [Pirellulales bacterium]